MKGEKATSMVMATQRLLFLVPKYNCREYVQNGDWESDSNPPATRIGAAHCCANLHSPEKSTVEASLPATEEADGL